MSIQWYYSSGPDIEGPISGRALLALAQSGAIVATDTVWQEGIEMGVKAGRVKHLFPALPAAVMPTAESSSIPTAAGKVETVNAPAPPPRVAPRAGRARAGKGAIIVAQDGKTVKFRMKCTACGREDSSWKSVPIPHGTHRASFYCTTCRKKRDAEISGAW